MRRSITKACKAAGIPLWSPHDLRHRPISLLHLRGMPWARIGAFVGQRDLSTIADTYTHAMIDETDLDYAELLGSAPYLSAAMEIAWRAPFTSAEVNALHAECFETRVFSDEEWDWKRLCEAHSLGWVSARRSGALVGFLNVLWDGLTHAWLQDVMVSRAARHAGVGTQLVARAQEQAREAGCEWLHVDFEEHLAPFYLGACGFIATRAGLIRL